MTDNIYDFPFGIMEVARILDIRIKRKGAKSVYADCPFCGDKRGKFNFNLSKDTYRCNYCGKGGGMLSLYSQLHNVSTTVAYQEICEILYGDGTVQDYELRHIKNEKDNLPESAELADVYARNQTYEMLLSMLILSPSHREKLRARGLTDECIDKFGYKSTPAFGFDKITKALADKGCQIEGVPGFYRKNPQVWSMNFKASCSGILIPVRTMSGLIQAFQIRLDRPFTDEKGKQTKYIWFSSVNNEKGVSSGGPAHFIGDPGAETVFITEGPLKADAAHCLSEKTFVAVAGVGNIKPLEDIFKILKKNGTQNVYECYDSDKYENEHVSRASKNLIAMIKAEGFNTKIMRWDKRYKGVDDFLLGKN